MLCNTVLRLFNDKLTGEMLSFSEAKQFLDNAIDEINTQLNTTYPAFSELPVGKADYDYFADRYIRSVVIPGAAWFYFVVDEEGINTAIQFKEDFSRGLFAMLRDTLYDIPEEYRAPIGQGTVTLQSDEDYGERGLVLNRNQW